MKVLISGGAGFVGSTIASACLDDGIEPIILDNLSVGRIEFTAGRAFYLGDICDGQMIDQIFRDHPEIATVVHCAALIQVPESVSQPLRYYQENVAKTLDFLGHILRNDCERLIFSSTAAVYGSGVDFTVSEESDIEPKSPYARTKAMAESILQDVVAASDLRALSLRYFNLIGADPLMRTGLQHRRPSHLLGKLIEATEDDAVFSITGVGWPTKDGTGVRDFVHVWDVARAHVAAIRRFDAIVKPGGQRHAVINLGTGQATTVREMVAAYQETIGQKLPIVEVGPRPGDVAGAYTLVDRAHELLGWRAEQTIEDGIRHSVQWARQRDKLLALPPS
jgi:UDP-glucose 4-epimerase